MAKISQATVDSLAERSGESREAVSAALQARGHTVIGQLTATDNPAASAGRKIAKSALGLLPTVGAMAAIPATGGMSLGPALLAAAAGSAAGAAGGEVARQGIARATGMEGPAPLASRASKVAQEAGSAAIGGAAGVPISRMAATAGRGLMTRALRIPGKLSRSFKDLDLPGLAIERGVRASKAGAEKTELSRRMLVGEVQKVIDRATKSGVKITVADLSKPALRQASRELRRPLTAQESRAIVQQVRSEVSERLGERAFNVSRPRHTVLTPQATDQLRRLAQQAAKRGYTAKEAGEVVTGNPDLSMAVAKGARSMLGKKVPGYNPRQSAAREAVALSRAVQGAAYRPPLASGGPVMLGFSTPALTPDQQSRLALMLAGRNPQAAFSRAPLAFKEVLDLILQQPGPYTEEP